MFVEEISLPTYIFFYASNLNKLIISVDRFYVKIITRLFHCHDTVDRHNNLIFQFSMLLTFREK